MSFEKKDTDNKVNKEEESIKAAELLSTNRLNPNAKDVEAKCFCTIRQFAYFTGGTPGQKRKIVKDQKIPPDDSFFWYGKAYAAIRKSILKNDSTFVYTAISELKKEVYEPDELFYIRNRDYSILALQSFLKISLPLEFRDLSKIRVLTQVKAYRLFGIDIKITPDVIFRAQYKGKTIIGAVRVNIKRKPPFTSTRMKVVSFLLYKFLQKHVAVENETVLPEFCLCIDVMAEKWMMAPAGTSAPNILLRETSVEYINMWETLQPSPRRR